MLFQLIQQQQPQGPYTLAGYSFGACVAFEMAVQLQTAGEKLDTLLLLDGSHAYVAAHTQQHRLKLTPGKHGEAESEALCAFVNQFKSMDYMEVNNFKYMHIILYCAW